MENFMKFIAEELREYMANLAAEPWMRWLDEAYS